jgi:hypothetical protein
MVQIYRLFPIYLFDENYLGLFYDFGFFISYNYKDYD